MTLHVLAGRGRVRAEGRLRQAAAGCNSAREGEREGQPGRSAGQGSARFAMSLYPSGALGQQGERTMDQIEALQMQIGELERESNKQSSAGAGLEHRCQQEEGSSSDFGRMQIPSTAPYS